MRRLFSALPLAFVLALTGPVGVGSAEAVQPATLAQAGAEAPEDQGPSQPGEEQPPPDQSPDDRQEPPEEQIPGPQVPPRMGDIRRPDPFEAAVDVSQPAPHPAALAYPDHDVVVCEAGCDKTAGTIVYMKKRE